MLLEKRSGSPLRPALRGCGTSGAAMPCRTWSPNSASSIASIARAALPGAARRW
ncbi:hypothetical protein [Sorangium sp. So ce1153]|uniref:hypothetical protein n=1 Tax=Sorangium sp. So ce1153 TaxID=3133333 RepID=UPI003F5E75DE